MKLKRSMVGKHGIFGQEPLIPVIRSDEVDVL